jgi:C1A family cysteine protease
MSVHVMTAAEASAATGAPDQAVWVDGYATGLVAPTASEAQRAAGRVLVVDSVAVPEALAPSDSTIYTSQCFPTVGNQMQQGSCAAWAATYYAYGYQEAADRGWSQASQGDQAQLMSAAWTYNKVTRGSGSWMYDNFMVLRDWGGATLSTMPYNDKDSISQGSEAAWREAPAHRAMQVFAMSYGTGTVDAIKTLIAQGVPVTFTIDAYQFSPAFTDGNYIISASEYFSSTLNHAQTFVGWDDSIYDDGDSGAFRVVNSWGAGWGDGGYYWVTYNAVKEMGGKGLLYATYATDRVDYDPSAIATWMYDSAPSADCYYTLTAGAWSMSPYPYGYKNVNHPRFQCIDVSDGAGALAASDLRLAASPPATGGHTGTLSSLKIESFSSYGDGSAPELISGMASGLPKVTPCYATVPMPAYAIEGAAEALGIPGIDVTSDGACAWIERPGGISGNSMQAGNILSGTSTISFSMMGPGTLTYLWMASCQPTGSTLTAYLDGESQGSITGTTDWAGAQISFGEGAHTISWAFAKGALAVGEDTCWVDSLSLDGEDVMPPVTQATVTGTAGANGWYTGPVQVELAATDFGSGVQSTFYSLDGAEYAGYAAPIDVAAAGRHTLRYYSVDVNGNTETARSTAVNIDAEAPQLLITSPADGASTGISVLVAWQGEDAISGVGGYRLRLDSGAWINVGLSTSYQITVAAGGSHTVTVEATDAAGNVRTATVTFNVTSAPTILVLKPLAGTYCIGSRTDITWETRNNAGAYVKIEVFKNGVLVSRLTSRTANDGQYTWSIATTLAASSGYTIKVSSTSSAAWDESEQFTLVKPTITVSSPSTGERLSAGSTCLIKWSCANDPSATVRIELYQNGRRLSILTSSTANDGQYEWVVPLRYAKMTGLTIKVTSSLTSGTSGVFSTI